MSNTSDIEGNIGFKKADYIEFKKKTGRQRSTVWTHFLRRKDTLMACCKLCEGPKPFLIPTSNQNTTGCKNHLQKVHFNVISNSNLIADISDSEPAGECPTMTANTLKLPFKTQLTSHKKQSSRFSGQQQTLDKFINADNYSSVKHLIAEMVTLDGIPVRKFAQSKGLRWVFSKAGFKLPVSEHSIRAMVMDYGEEVEKTEKLKIKTKKVKGEKFSITTDEWTSLKSKRFANINVHYQNSSFVNLGLVPIQGSFTGNACLSLVKKRLEDFGISMRHDIISTTNDGASNMVKYGELSPTHQQLCFAHAIQLGVVDVLYPKKEKAKVIAPTNSFELVAESQSELNVSDSEEEHSDEEIEFEDVAPAEELEIQVGDSIVPINHEIFGPVIKKIRSHVFLFRKSVQKNEILQKHIEDENEVSEKTKRYLGLLGDGKTRWSSMYKMVSRYIKLGSCVEKAIIDCKRKNIMSKKITALSGKETQLAQKPVSGLKPVKVAVESLCAENATLLSADVVFEILLNSLLDQNTKFSLIMFNAIRRRFLARRTVYSDVYRYLHFGEDKNEESDTDTLSSDSEYEFTDKFKFERVSKSIVKSEIMALLKRVLPSSNYPDSDEDITSHSTQKRLKASEPACLGKSSVKTQFKEAIANLNVAKSRELSNPNSNRSLSEQISEEIKRFELSGRDCVRGHHLELVYNFLKTIKPTSVESERAFSAAGNFCTKLRSGLGDATLNMFCFLRSHFMKNQKPGNCS